MTLWCHDRMNVCADAVSEFMRSNSFIIFFLCTLCLNQCRNSFSLPFTLHHSSSSSVSHPTDTDKLYVSVKHITDRSYVHIEINSKQVRLAKTLFVIFRPTKFITIIHQDRPSQIERCRRRAIVNQMRHSTDYGEFMSILSYSAGLIIYIKVRNLWDKKKKFWYLKECMMEIKGGGIVPRLTETIVIRKIETSSSYTILLWCGVWTSLFCHLVLVMTLWVRSISALLDLFTSSSSLSGRDSIASAARFACFIASSLVFCMPWLLPRYSRTCIFRR